MNCSDFNSLLDRAIRGTVSPGERDAMKRHAATCRGCAQLLEAQEMIAATFESTEPVSAPPNLADRIRARVDAEASGVIVPFRTPETITCETFEADAAAFVDGLLSDDRIRAFVDHRASCEACDRLASTHEKISAAFAATEPVPAPAGLADRIRAAAYDTQTAAEPSVAISRFRKFTIPAAAAAFTGLFAGGMLLSSLRSPDTITPGPFAQLIDSVIMHIIMLPALFEAWIARSISSEQWILIARLLEPVESPYLSLSISRLSLFAILSGAAITWGLAWRFITTSSPLRQRF